MTWWCDMKRHENRIEGTRNGMTWAGNVMTWAKARLTDWLTGWLTKSTTPWIDEWTDKVNEWGTDWVSDWTRKWIHEGMIWMNAGKHECTCEWMDEWEKDRERTMNERTIDWLTDRLAELRWTSVNELTIRRMNEKTRYESPWPTSPSPPTWEC